MNGDMMTKAIDAKEKEMISFLERLVNIDSGADNPDGIAKVAKIVGEKLAQMNFEVEYIEHPGICTHVKAKKRGTGDQEIMIIGHIDTLFGKGTVAERPFTIKDGKAFGPGVLDMKGGVTVALFALQTLYEAGWNDQNVTVFLAGDEETNHPKTNAAELFEQEAKGKAAVFNMETASSGQAVLVGRKGNMHPEFVVTGVAAHAGADLTKGANAIVELAYKIIDINNLMDHARGLTFNVGVISGGVVANAVPDRASVKVDVRYLTLADRDQAIASLKEIAAKNYVPGTTTEIANFRENMTPMEVTAGNKWLYEIVRQQGEKLGIQVEAKVGGGSSDSGWTVRAGAPSLCSMGARGEFNHSAREYIFLESLTERAKLLALSIQAI